MTHLLVIGDAMLDQDLHGDVSRVCPDAPVPVVDVQRRHVRPGGAGLAARLLAGGPGVTVSLATATADDDAGQRLRALLGEHVEVCSIATVSATRCLTRVRSQGQSLLRLDDPGEVLPEQAPLDTDVLVGALDGCDAVLVADYGCGLAAHPQIRHLLEHVARDKPVVWDPHPRGAQPLPGPTVCTPNRAEVERALGLSAGAALDEAAASLRRAWGVGAVVATDGARGAFTAVSGRDAVLFTPATAVPDVDTCGAGDRFAGTLTAALARGEALPGAVGEAVADVEGWLAGGGVGVLGEPLSDSPAQSTQASEPARAAGDVVAAVRARGGVVVATGGCFDVVHAGHVASLEAARRLGDCLVVLINSDESVTRLKGQGRPVHAAQDRRRVLASLSPVDAVIVFDEDDPSAALERLRPDIWAKGGDYADQRLPEADLVASWGGRVVLLPFLPGRSTTRILTHRSQASPRESVRKVNP